jgi:hypothetical protein
LVVDVGAQGVGSDPNMSGMSFEDEEQFLALAWILQTSRWPRARMLWIRFVNFMTRWPG